MSPISGLENGVFSSCLLLSRHTQPFGPLCACFRGSASHRPRFSTRGLLFPLPCLLLGVCSAAFACDLAFVPGPVCTPVGGVTQTSAFTMLVLY